MSRPTARKLEAIVQKADSGDSEARAALDALNEQKMSVDAAYQKVAAPKRDTASIEKDDRVARDFNQQCKVHALDADVFRSEREGRFHLTIYNLNKAQVSQFLEFLESNRGSKRGPSRPDSAPCPQAFFRRAASPRARRAGGG
jgi:hypothetical protein